ncbi:MAG: VOC family protein [Pirellula sp.]|jgi:catechol 2,3-dioxygenase-like lactoylglutathione lyase family enzyme
MEDESKPIDTGKVRFTMLRLQATRLEEMRSFYHLTLGLPVESDVHNSLSIRFGQTVIEFQGASDKSSKPFYHFAFNIPENKFAEAKRWLAKRCTLLKDPTGADELFFSKWNAHAVYFADPAGNIGELIARHTLANAAAGAFDQEDILYASEIGLVAHDPKALGTEIGAHFGLPGGGSMFVGDPSGYFVLPPVSRLWIPEEKQKASIYPAEVKLAVETEIMEYRARDLPYVIFADGKGSE